MWDVHGNYYGPEAQTAPLLSTQDAKKQKHLVETDYKGFTTKRKFRDLICAVIFFAVIASMCGISFLSFAKGNPSLLVPNQPYVNSDDIVKEGGSWLQRSVTDLKENAPLVAGAVMLSFFLGLLWVELIKRMTKVVVYGTITLGFMIMIAVSFFSIAKAIDDGSTALLVFGIIVIVGTCVLMVAVIFLHSRINLTCDLISETCIGFQANYVGTLVVSVTIAVAYCGFFAFWGASFVYLYSIPEKMVTIENQVIPKFDESVRNLMYFQIFALFWISNFFSALFQMAIAGTMSQWYFTREENSGLRLDSPAVRSLLHGLTYSFGSLAFGSLVIAIINFIQFLINQARRSAKFKWLQWLLCCVECAFGCIESLARFINKFSYIYIAMHGYSFLKASKTCFGLLSRNFLSAAVVDYLTFYVLFIAKLIGTGASVLLTYVILIAMDKPVTSVTLTLVIAGAYLTFSLFSTVIDAGVDTIYVCYAEDLERNPNNLSINPSIHHELQEIATQNKETPSEN